MGVSSKEVRNFKFILLSTVLKSLVTLIKIAKKIFAPRKESSKILNNRISQNTKKS